MVSIFILMCITYINRVCDTDQGQIQDFKLGGAQLKKLRRAEGGTKIFGVFRVKNHDFMQKNNIFSNFRGGARRLCPPPPLNPPLQTVESLWFLICMAGRWLGCLTRSVNYLMYVQNENKFSSIKNIEKCYITLCYINLIQR